jgi:hypothetical protein
MEETLPFHHISLIDFSSEPSDYNNDTNLDTDKSSHDFFDKDNLLSYFHSETDSTRILPCCTTNAIQVTDL